MQDTRIIGPPIPVGQVQGLQLPKTQWRLDTVEADGNKHAAIATDPGLVLHPKRFDRAPGPRHHDAGRLIDRTVDDRRVALSGNDARIPPGGDLIGLEQPHKPLHRPPILPLVTDKDVSHLPWSLLGPTTLGPTTRTIFQSSVRHQPGCDSQRASEATSQRASMHIVCGPSSRQDNDRRCPIRILSRCPSRKPTRGECSISRTPSVRSRSTSRPTMSTPGCGTPSTVGSTI